jgi:hypothetical protein
MVWNVTYDPKDNDNFMETGLFQVLRNEQYCFKSHTPLYINWIYIIEYARTCNGFWSLFEVFFLITLFVCRGVMAQWTHFWCDFWSDFHGWGLWRKAKRPVATGPWIWFLWASRMSVFKLTMTQIILSS